MNTAAGIHPFPLAIDVLNPSDRLDIADGAQIPLCGRPIGVPEDDLANDFDGNARW